MPQLNKDKLLLFLIEGSKDNNILSADGRRQLPDNIPCPDKVGGAKKWITNYFKSSVGSMPFFRAYLIRSVWV
jgi:hypothetical protein